MAFRPTMRLAASINPSTVRAPVTKYMLPLHQRLEPRLTAVTERLTASWYQAWWLLAQVRYASPVCEAKADMQIVSGVVAYVRSQLRKESDTMNRMFAQQNTAQVRAARNQRLLVDSEGDPRKTPYNVLNW